MGFFLEPRNFGLGFFVGVAAGGSATILCVQRDLIPPRLLGEQKETLVVPPEPPKKSVPPLEASYQHPALKYGPPSSGLGMQHLRMFDSFVAAFDSRTRNPSWVLEHLTQYKDRREDVDRAKSAFVEDEMIEARFRTKPTDFENSGYDRGHMAPAADHNQSQKAMNDTFTLTYDQASQSESIGSPVGTSLLKSVQDSTDYWARFEKFVRNLVKVSMAVYVATGPLWLPEKEAEGKYTMKYPMIGKPPALISVPTHFYKVILAEPLDINTQNGNNNGSSNAVPSKRLDNCAVAAFVMPNRSIAVDVPLTRFAVPISDLESATGLTFFPKYMTDDRRNRLDRAALVWRSIGRTLYGQSNVPLLQTLDGMEPESTKQTKAERDAAKIKRKEAQPITSQHIINNHVKFKSWCVLEKKCSLEPHLCYHAECALPPPEFWKKTTASDATSASKKGTS